MYIGIFDLMFVHSKIALNPIKYLILDTIGTTMKLKYIEENGSATPATKL
jgi:hypothetical protein